MALTAYGCLVSLIGLALFDRYPLAAGLAVFVGVSLAALGHTGIDGRGPESGDFRS
jgi:hypothetical protein